METKPRPEIPEQKTYREEQYDQMFHLANGKVSGITAVWLSLLLMFDTSLRKEFIVSRRLIQDLKLLQETTPKRRPIWPRGVVRRPVTITFGGKTVSHRIFLYAYVGVILTTFAVFIVRPNLPFLFANGDNSDDVDSRSYRTASGNITTTINLTAKMEDRVAKRIRDPKFPTVPLRYIGRTEVNYANHHVTLTGSMRDVIWTAEWLTGEADRPIEFATAGAEIVATKVTLTNKQAEELVSTIKSDRLLPISLAIVSEGLTNSVLLAGTKADVANAKILLVKMDVAPRQVLLKMRLIQVAFDASGKREDTTLVAPILSTADNIKASVSVADSEKDKIISGWKVEATPHLGSGNMMELVVTMTKLGKRSGLNGSGVRGKRIIQTGKPIMFMGMLEKGEQKEESSESRAAIGLGIVPENARNFVGYFLDVNATENVDKPATP